jgi:hypothetical protein
MSVFSRWSFSSLSAQFSLDAATRVILRWPISFPDPMQRITTRNTASTAEPRPVRVTIYGSYSD